MDMRKCVVSAALALAAAVTYPTAAQAQQRDRCNDYANQMMSFDQRARQLKCNVWNKPVYNYQQHYNWCDSKPVSVAEDGLSTWGSLFQRCQFQASGAPAAQPPRPAGATLRSGSYSMNSSNNIATVTLNVQGASFSGQSSWQCCPTTRIDPIIEGRIANGRVTFVRDCRGQGYPGPCRQTYTGVISGNSVSGTWSGTGIAGTGRWSMRLR